MKRHKAHVAFLITIIASAFLLAGCAGTSGVLPTSSQLRDTNQLETLNSLKTQSVSLSTWPSLNWWTRYGDPQLDQIVIEALSDQPALRVAEARVRQAIALSGIAHSTKYLQVAANLKDTQQRFSEHSTVPKPVAGSWNTLNETTLNFSYEFDFWGKNQSAIEAAVDRVHASEVDAQSARLVLISSVVQTYFRLAQGHDQLELAELVQKQREQVLELTKQRVTAGIDSEIDLKQAESAIPPAKQQVAAWREIIDITHNQLSALVGKGPDWGLKLARPQLRLDHASAIPVTVPADLIGRRPDVVAQRWRVEAASQDIKIAHAQFYPNISLLAFIGYQSLGLNEFLNTGSRIAGIGPAINLPIFDGGRLRSNLGSRHADYDIAVEQYNQTIVDALQDVVNQLTSIQWLEQQHSQQIEAVKTAQESYGLAMQRYQSGIGNYLQVLATELQVHAQKKLLIDLDSRALQLDAQLTRSLGGSVLDAMP